MELPKTSYPLSGLFSLRFTKTKEIGCLGTLIAGTTLLDSHRLVVHRLKSIYFSDLTFCPVKHINFFVQSSLPVPSGYDSP